MEKTVEIYIKGNDALSVAKLERMAKSVGKTLSDYINSIIEKKLSVISG